MRLIKSEKEIRDFLNVLRDRAAGGSQEIELRVRAILDDVGETLGTLILRVHCQLHKLKAP